MNPTSVRNLLLSLGLASGLGAAVNGCSSHEDPGGPNGAGGINGAGGFIGGNGLGGYTGGSGGINGAGGNSFKGGATGQNPDAAEAGADTGGDTMSTGGNDGSTSGDADPAGG